MTSPDRMVGFGVGIYALGSKNDDRSTGTGITTSSIAVQRPYVRAFFDKHLCHRDGRLLAGPSDRYPEMPFLPWTRTVE
jgi:hypothetical protein